MKMIHPVITTLCITNVYRLNKQTFKKWHKKEYNHINDKVCFPNIYTACHAPCLNIHFWPASTRLSLWQWIAPCAQSQSETERETVAGSLTAGHTLVWLKMEPPGVKCGDWQLVPTSLWTILGNCESCTSKSEVCSDCVSVWQVVVENDWTSTERAIPAFRREGMATQRTRSSSNKHCRAIRMATNVASESWKDRSLTCQRENTCNHHQEYLVQVFKGTVYPKRKICR